MNAEEKTRQPEGKAKQRVLTLVVTVLFAFGLVVPALVLAFNGADKASVGPGGVHLNSQQQKGREDFATSCAYCHTLKAVKSVGRIGPNLDYLVPLSGSNQASREAFVLSAIETGFARGNGQMPAMLYQGVEAKAVASFVAAVAGH